MSYKDHAMLEFKACKWIDEKGVWKDDMQKLICEQVLELLDLFSKHGHSGSSAPYAVGLFEKLAMFEPVCDLTGEDWEWSDCGDGLFQNKRCSHVFKNGKKGRAYDIEGKIFRYPDGGCFTSGESRVDITFPYKPKREYVDVPFRK